jgi:hypothetical protein
MNSTEKALDTVTFATEVSFNTLVGVTTTIVTAIVVGILRIGRDLYRQVMPKIQATERDFKDISSQLREILIAIDGRGDAGHSSPITSVGGKTRRARSENPKSRRGGSESIVSDRSG